MTKRELEEIIYRAFHAGFELAFQSAENGYRFDIQWEGVKDYPLIDSTTRNIFNKIILDILNEEWEKDIINSNAEKELHEAYVALEASMERIRARWVAEDKEEKQATRAKTTEDKERDAIGRAREERDWRFG